MQVLSIMSPKPGADPAEFAPRAIAEEKAVWAIDKAGPLRGMRLQADPVRGLLTFEAPDKTVVVERLATYPQVADQLSAFELIAAGPSAPPQVLSRDGR